MRGCLKLDPPLGTRRETTPCRGPSNSHQTTDREAKIAALKEEHREAIIRRDKARDAMMMAGSTALRLQQEIAHLEGWPRHG